MADLSTPMPGQASPRPDLNTKFAPTTAIIFILLLATGLLFTVYGIYTDIRETRAPVTTYIPFLLPLAYSAFAIPYCAKSAKLLQE